MKKFGIKPATDSPAADNVPPPGNKNFGIKKFPSPAHETPVKGKR